MQRFIPLFYCLLLTSFHASAEQAESMAGMNKGMGMMGMMMPMSDEQMEARMKAKQAHMLMMHDLSNKILAETDPVKKQALKDQQIELMKAHHKKMMTMHKQKMNPHHKMQNN